VILLFEILAAEITSNKRTKSALIQGVDNPPPNKGRLQVGGNLIYFSD
jgi:hypothetical protein